MFHSNRRTRKTETTRDSLKNAFIELILQDNQVEAITVSEIADSADFNRGTFYSAEYMTEQMTALYKSSIVAMSFRRVMD